MKPNRNAAAIHPDEVKIGDTIERVWSYDNVLPKEIFKVEVIERVLRYKGVLLPVELRGWRFNGQHFIDERHTHLLIKLNDCP